MAEFKAAPKFDMTSFDGRWAAGIDLLRRVHVEQQGFYMGMWCETFGDCGTVACAGGHFALNPLFNAAGLTLTPEVDDRSPVYRGVFGYEALADFFGISIQYSCFIFDPNYYPAWTSQITALDVANRMAALDIKKARLPG